MYKLFSVDDHIIEPAHVWSSRVPAKYRDAAPHVVEEDGREYWVYEDRRNDTMGLERGGRQAAGGVEPRARRGSPT